MLKVAAAATLEPEIAPNTPLAAITTEASPPGSQPSHLSSAANRRFTAPLPENTAPMKMKSGIASSVNELRDSQAVQALFGLGHRQRERAAAEVAQRGGLRGAGG